MEHLTELSELKFSKENQSYIKTSPIVKEIIQTKWT